MNQHLLLTGASGFVGGKVFERLIADGEPVIGFGRRELASPHYHSLDLTTQTPPVDSSCRAVIHAAARSSPWGSRREFARQNIETTRNLLEACERGGRPKFVFISSSSVYYQPEHQLNISEQTPLADPACNHYAWSKQQGESLVRKYQGPWVILRPRAVFGPGDTVLFPRILTAARAGKLPILENPAGPAIGDLIYIDNLTDVIIRAATDDAITGEYNVTNNHPVEIAATLLEIFERLEIAAPKRRVPLGRAMFAAGAIETLYRWLIPFREPPITRFGVHVFAYSKTFDVSKMIETFGAPRIGFDEGLHRFIEWVKSTDRVANLP